MYFIQRHPLEDVLPSQMIEQAADHMTVLLRPTVFSVLAASGAEVAVARTLAALQDVSVRRCGPAEWLLICENLGRDALARSLKDAALRFVDQTHAYAVVRLSGPHVRTILAKGTGVDLHRDVFAVGQSANALYGQVHINLARVGDDMFELAVVRSYADFFFQDLMQAGREFGLTAAFDGRG